MRRLSLKHTLSWATLFAHVSALAIVLLVAVAYGQDGSAPSQDSDSSVSESAKDWRYPHTPQLVRFGVGGGGHAAGPIRYNTHFPEVKGNPHPTSYFLGPAHFGVEMDVAFSNGGLLMGVLERRDVAHPGINSRTTSSDDRIWRVDDFAFRDRALMVGWVFGERYREAPWSADLALVYDDVVIDSRLTQDASQDRITGRVDMQAISLRARLQVRVAGWRAIMLSAGPEIYVPLWFQQTDKSELPVRPWFREVLELKPSAALGLGATMAIGI